jgi:hypothetical protein
VARTLGPFESAVLLDAASGAEPPRQTSPDVRFLPNYEAWGIPVRYAGTPVETVSLDDARQLERRLGAQIGGGE